MVSRADFEQAWQGVRSRMPGLHYEETYHSQGFSAQRVQFDMSSFFFADIHSRMRGSLRPPLSAIKGNDFCDKPKNSLKFSSEICAK